MKSTTDDILLNQRIPYAELHCLSNFSFLRGASHPEELIYRAAELGYEALAITDECSLAGVVRAHQAIKDQQLSTKLIIGSEFYDDQSNSCYVLLAPDKHAYSELSQLISRCRRRAEKRALPVSGKRLINLKFRFSIMPPR